ncbi:MAG: hypothetical protein Q9184_004662 [Pyrenodesmia sp. 2 TL-2023]
MAQATTPNADFVRQTNLSHILEHSDGSPNRFLKTSPNPGNGSNVASARVRPNNLGFGNIGEGLQVNNQQVGAGPKSAPAQVNTFEQAGSYVNRGPWNENMFDDRWLHHSQEMYVTDARRTSILTISPDQIPHRTPQDSNISSAYPSSSHLDLLQAQYGMRDPARTGAHESIYPAGRLSNQGYSAASPSFPAQSQEASSAISLGRGYDTLRAYVEKAANGQPRKLVPELEQLMSTMLYLRGEGDALPSMHHFGQDALRQFLYKSVFGTEDGSSSFSRENPLGRIEIAGQFVTRQKLHDEMVYFLEDQLESMTASLIQDSQRNPSPQLPLQPSGNGGNRKVEDGGREAHNQANPRGMQSPSAPEGPHSDQGGVGQAIQAFDAMSLVAPALPDQKQIQAHPGGMPAGTQGQQQTPGSALYEQVSNVQQQQYMSMLQQQIAQQQQQQMAQQAGPFVPQQFIHHPGMLSGPAYMQPPNAPLAYYPGRQMNPYAAQFSPYATPFLPSSGFHVPQYGPHLMQPQFVPNFHPAMGGLPQMASFAPSSVRPIQQFAPQWPPSGGRIYVPSSGRSSPMPRAQSRGGRNVISDVPLLPYRPGSDDMYPHATAEGSSVRLQELQRQGPTYEVAAQPENFPFIEAARRARPAEWGVLKIGNIPYSLTKQEVLGFLGRNAKILTPEIGVPIHIIMDRTNGKTMDCYVEFFSHGDAQAAFNKCLLRGNQLRLGDRVVDVCLSTQDELLKEMFPKAKNVEWSHGRPIVKDSTDPYNSGFKAFVTNEELLQLVSYAEKPHRSNYTQKCLQRPYESMISLLSKVNLIAASTLLPPSPMPPNLNQLTQTIQFPWFAVDRYTVQTRDEMYKQTAKLLSLLDDQLRRGTEAYLPHISESLLTELLYAGLNAPAFSEQQRWHLVQAAGTPGERVRMSPLVPYWPFEVLGRKAGLDEDYVKVS